MALYVWFEAFPAAFFGMLLFFVPKTPRYLVLVQQEEKAYTILEKINGKKKAQEILNDIKATAQEKQRNSLLME